jgi:hypothetical protein
MPDGVGSGASCVLDGASSTVWRGNVVAAVACGNTGSCARSAALCRESASAWLLLCGAGVWNGAYRSPALGACTPCGRACRRKPRGSRAPVGFLGPARRHLAGDRSGTHQKGPSRCSNTAAPPAKGRALHEHTPSRTPTEKHAERPARGRAPAAERMQQQQQHGQEKGTALIAGHALSVPNRGFSLSLSNTLDVRPSLQVCIGTRSAREFQPSGCLCSSAARTDSSTSLRAVSAATARAL